LKPAEVNADDMLLTFDATVDTSVMREVLAPIVAAQHDDAVRIQELEVDILRRRPWRGVLRYRMQLANGSAGALQPFNLIGKVFVEGQGDPVYRKMESLWDAGFARNPADAVSMPRAHTFVSDLQLLVQEEVPGRSVKDALRLEASPRTVRQVAQGLIKLHGCDFVPPRRFRMREHLDRLALRFPILERACPDLMADIDDIVRSAAEMESRHGEEIFTVTHGDLHLGQVWVEGEQVFLIDFDALADGDPAADLGSLLVSMKAKTKKMDTGAALVDALLDEYFQHMDSSIADRVPVYEAITHLRRAGKRPSTPDARWKKKVRRMVRAAVECMDAG
jgi:tRNA A-37 threonylcarbamoyl transferase component Bud32